MIRLSQLTQRQKLIAAAVAAVVAIGGILFAVLGGGGEAPLAAPSPTPAPPTPSPTPSPTPPPLLPLTGEPVEDLAVLEQPSLAVKIENSAAARPQAGLDEADIVLEELVEGGITRFIALFHSSLPASVGPVRSARPVDTLVLPAFEAALGYSGARPEVLRQLQGTGLVTLTEGDPGFSRDRGRTAPSNLFLDAEQVVAAATERGAEPAVAVGWEFSDEAPSGSVGGNKAGREISILMSGVSRTGWQYDASAGVYRRFQNGQPSAVTGEGRIGAANVLVLATPLVDGGCCDAAGSRYVDTELVGEGRAVLLRDGRWYEGRYEKKGPNQQFVLTRANGKPLVLKPGATWVHLAPPSGIPDQP